MIRERSNPDDWTLDPAVVGIAMNTQPMYVLHVTHDRSSYYAQLYYGSTLICYGDFDRMYRLFDRLINRKG